MNEETRKQLEQEIADLRSDLKRAEDAEAVLKSIREKHGLYFGTISEDIKSRIYSIETTIDPSILALDFARRAAESVNATPPMSGYTPAVIALANEYLKLRGELPNA